MKIFSFVTKKFLIYLGVGVVLVVVGIWSFGGSDAGQIATVVRGDVIQEVVATGKVKPNQSVDLGFEQSGRIGAVYASVGDLVQKNQMLVALESGALRADLVKAKASLLEENIKLREIKNTAPISFNDASKNLRASIQGGFADADNAVRNKADQFFKNLPDNPRFEVSITSGNFVHYFEISNDLKIDLNNTRKKVELILDNWEKRIQNVDTFDLVVEADLAINDLRFITSFLDKMAEAINSFVSADYDYDTTVAGYKTAISSARSQVSEAISSVVIAKDKLNSAPTLGVSGQFEDVLAQEAKVKQAEANVASFEASLNNAIIRAPFDGVVTVQDTKVGGTVSPNNPMVSIISQNQMYIEANISEINISKISLVDPVFVTLDAFPNEVFGGEVSYIEPGDLILDGVVNYKIRISLNEINPKIKSGLTANLKIQVDQKTDVLTLPIYAILKEGDLSFVNKIIGKNIEKTLITIGISGNNGLTEILSGLEVGDRVEF